MGALWALLFLPCKHLETCWSLLSWGKHLGQGTSDLSEGGRVQGRGQARVRLKQKYLSCGLRSACQNLHPTWQLPMPDSHPRAQTISCFWLSCSSSAGSCLLSALVLEWDLLRRYFYVAFQPMMEEHLFCELRWKWGKWRGGWCYHTYIKFLLSCRNVGAWGLWYLQGLLKLRISPKLQSVLVTQTC